MILISSFLNCQSKTFMRGIIIFRIGSLVGSTFCLTYLLNLPNILYSFACGESETDEQSFGGVHSNLESLGVYG